MKLQTKSYKLKATKGFTLIELLLYVSLSGIIIFSVSIFMAVLLQARVKNQTIAEVQHNGDRIMQIITQTLRNSTVINSPTTGTSSAVLSVDTVIPANNPTVFDMSGGVVRMKEGAGAAVALTSNRVEVSDLNFDNLTRPDTPGNIHISFILSHIHD